MKNPLSQEQIKKLNELAKLPKEKQQQELQKFLKTLNPEQMQFLQAQQGGNQQQCPFCAIAEGKLASKKIYEDSDFIAVLDINPANPGHTIVFPKKHFSLLTQMKDVGELFNVANKLSKYIFEATKAQGTNIFVANGQVAGQTVPHIFIHIIPRFQDDGLNFLWEPKKIDEKNMEKITSEIKELIEEDKEVKEEKEPSKYDIEERFP